MTHQNRPEPAVLDTTLDGVAAVAELARQAVGTGEPVTLNPGAGPGEIRAWVLHNTQNVHLEPLERFQPLPYRQRGAARTTEPAAFVEYVRRLATDQTTIWVDQASWTSPPAVTAVLNDHNDEGLPGWRDHRVTLVLRPTPLWSHWVGRDGKLIGQLEFAEHVEDGLTAVVVPAAADMLEIAQTFHAARQVEFSSATRVTNGEVQLRWHEETQAGAGRNRSLEIPERFTLMLEPWPGSGGAYEVEARLRWRLDSGRLLIGYRLDRVDEVMRQAALDLRNRLAEDLPDQLVLAGAAPEPVAPAGHPF